MLLLPWECGNPMNTLSVSSCGYVWGRAKSENADPLVIRLLLFRTSDRVQTWLLCFSAREHHPKSLLQGGRGMAVVGPPLLSPHGAARIAGFLRNENISGSWRWSA